MIFDLPCQGVTDSRLLDGRGILDLADLDDFDEEEEVLEMMEEEEEDDEAPSKDPAPNPIPRRNVRLVQTVRKQGFKK